jgi:hypothetical protein
MNLSKWLMLVLMFAIGNMHAALKVTVVKKDENAFPIAIPSALNQQN